MTAAQKKRSQSDSSTITITPPMIAGAVIVLIPLVVFIVRGVHALSGAPSLDQSTIAAHMAAKRHNPNLN